MKILNTTTLPQDEFYEHVACFIPPKTGCLVVVKDITRDYVNKSVRIDFEYEPIPAVETGIKGIPTDVKL